MLERIINCISRPKFIGKYFKDKASTIFLTILIFFIAYVLVLGVKCYSEEYFDSDSLDILVSDVWAGDVNNVYYDPVSKVLVGNSVTYFGENHYMVFLPGDDFNVGVDKIAQIGILLYADYGLVSVGGVSVGKINYADFNFGGFSLADVKSGVIEDSIMFKAFLDNVLNSSSFFFNTQVFIKEMISTLLYYGISVLFVYFGSKLINPGIGNKVRIKLCFYDGVIFFLFSIFVCLFNASWINFIAVIFPIIYGNITFRHIVKISVRKDEEAKEN